jgi:DNA-binding transcriptional LysR family regulator
MSTIPAVESRVPDLSGLLAFVRVAELGSFVRASESLGLSKAAVSKQVAALERRLNTRLLHRTTRRLSLTEDGQAYLLHAQAALAEVRSAEDAVSGARGAAHGRLRLSVPTTFGMLHVAPFLHSFMQRYPQVSLDIQFDDRTRDLLMENLDVVIRVGRLASSSLVARKLATSRVVLCAAPSYLKAHGQPTRPDDVVLHQCLHFSLAGQGRIWELTCRGETVRTAINARLFADSSLALKVAALAGAGILRIPEFAVATELQRGELEVVLPQWKLPSLDIHAVMPERRYLPAKVRAFVEFLSECWASRPGLTLIESSVPVHHAERQVRQKPLS